MSSSAESSDSDDFQEFVDAEMNWARGLEMDAEEPDLEEEMMICELIEQNERDMDVQMLGAWLRTQVEENVARVEDATLRWFDENAGMVIGSGSS